MKLDRVGKLSARLFSPRSSIRPSSAHHSDGLDTLCEFAPCEGGQEELVLWFVRVVDWLRPGVGQAQTAQLRLHYLEVQLKQHPHWRDNVSRAFSRLVASCDIPQWLSYAGIAYDLHFWGAIARWVNSRMLPAACATQDAAQIVTMAFRKDEGEWMRQLMSSPTLLGLIDPALQPALRRALSDALQDLTHQVVSQAHSPLVRKLSTVERSPFRGLYEAVAALDAAPDVQPAARAVLGRLDKCMALVDAHRAALAERGADLNTTFQLSRLRRQLKRLALLAGLRHDASPERVGLALGELGVQAVGAATGRRLLWGSADLVVQNIVDTAAAVGRDYLELVQTSAWSAFRAGAWGGLLMAFATASKYLLSGLHLPRLYEGLVHSLNYSAVFCAAYILHFTIATKLPAHTAAALARGLQQGSSYSERLLRFGVTWRAMVRLQLAGLFGNVLVVAPAAAAIAYGFRKSVGHELLSSEKAAHVLADQSLLGPSLVFAALTGVLLWISSLVGAFVDNWARVTKLSDRLATSIPAMRRGRPEQARARAVRITTQLGGLAANLTLGFLLGGVPTLFALAELPVEIRHVTVSVGSVAMAVVAGARGIEPVSLALGGLCVIGLTNVVVSFSLALWLALRATRGLEGDSSSRALINIGLRRWSRSLLGLTA